MDTYYLSKHVYPCHTQGFTILLDLENDRYRALDENSTRELTGIVDGWVSLAGIMPGALPSADQRDCSLARDMAAKNLLTRDARQGKTAEPLRLRQAVSGVVDDDLWSRPAVPIHELMFFVVAVMRAAVLLREWPLNRIVPYVRRRKLRYDPPDDLQSLKRLVTAFEALQPFVFVSRDACLFHAFALIEFLALHRISASWIFGVRAMPFSAHCWVQHEDIVLNDDPDTVRRFRPIMLV